MSRMNIASRLPSWMIAVPLLAVLVVLAGCSSTPPASAMERAAAAKSPAMKKAAPDFTLRNQDEQAVTLSQQRGRWVVLYFYPQADTPGCVCQASEFTNLLTEFHTMDAVVLGVSPDQTLNLKLFQEKYNLKLTLLSDPTKQVMRRYGAWVDTQFGEEMSGRVVRSTYLIDPQGQVAYHWPEVIPQGHAQRVREKLLELQRGG